MISDDSGVKFFDRKFVAANLRSELRCPKCAREYSHKFTAGGAAENHRPFLLSCGHNMCEFCLSKHRQETDFKCAVCFNTAPPTINTKSPKGPGNIRDYYELNYHVLGETTSLDYFRRYSVESVNKSLTCSFSSDIVLEPKCSECSSFAAQGECSQCNAFYCKRCFDMVHNHSRVLKTHSFQGLTNNKRPNKGIRVGKDIFRMPKHMLCSDHKKPADIYCHWCKRCCCNLCFSKHHSSHKTSFITELNQRYLTEVPASINSIDAALLQVQNAQMIVKSSKKKLGDFADKTLAEISKHFRFLHGQLQNAELQTIEKLRESSLPPQMKLNEAMSQLNGYEMVLNKLRSFLHPTVSQDTFLRDVISAIQEHLEKIPTNVKVTKINKNPYQLVFQKSITCTLTENRITKTEKNSFRNTIENLSEMIENHFITKFVDPQIVVRFNSSFNQTYRSTISEMNYSQNSEISDFSRKNTSKLDLVPVSVQGQMQKRDGKKENNKTSSFNRSGIEFDSKHNNFLRTFSAMDISKSNESTSITQASRIGDWFKSDVVVRVLSVISPEDFYVQSAHVAQRIREQLEAFATRPDCQTPSIIVVGQHYIVHNNQTESDRWHRALVIQKSGQIDMYNVFLPDIGLHHSIHCKNFRQLPEDLASLPYAAVHCSLKQLMPSQCGAEWGLEAAAFLKQVVQKYPVHINVLRSLGPQFYEVDLITNNYKSNISVRESFLYTGLARSRSGYPHTQLPNPQQLMALSTQRLPRYNLSVGTVLMIQLLNVEHPHEFYVMPHKEENRRRDLQNELQRVMNLTGLSDLEPIYLGRLQLACVMNFEGHWHRACIEQMLPEGYVLVRMVDSGIMQKLFWDQLFMLPDGFWKQEYAIKCCLADVETLQKHGYAWTKTAIDAFKQLISNPKLHMEVISLRDKVANVSLSFARSGTDNTNVAAWLVDQGHCLSCGESSQVIKPISVKTPLDANTRKLIELNKASTNELGPHVPTKTVKLQRSAIKILHVVHPSEFYVTLTHFLPAIDDLRETVQKIAEKMYQHGESKEDWRTGDMCYIRMKARGDWDELWHRGQIVEIHDNVEFKYDVKLRDIGEVIGGVHHSSLVIMDETLEKVSNSAVRCHLYGISAKNSEWAPGAIQFFKFQVNMYSSLHVIGHGREGDSLCVTLWGAFPEITGPFVPVVFKYININNQLISDGWAEKISSLPLEVEEPIVSDHTTTTLDTCDPDLKACLDSVDKLSASRHLLDESAADNCFAHDCEMPPLELLKDFNMETPTTGCAEAPLAWQLQRECKKSIYTAIPTYVNFQCEIYLSSASDKLFIQHMRKLLEERFRPMFDHQNHVPYVKGQAVVVKYHMDNLIYRGIVKSNINAKGLYTVYYVDYGNEEEVMPSEMLPYAPFSQLKALCWRVAVHGVQPKEQQYSLTAMDTVHHQVVTKMCSVRVVEVKGPNGLPLCQIKVAGMDIATMMVDNKFANLTPHAKYKYVMPPKEKLESFKMFDELLQLGNLPSPIVFELNNTTVKPPPAKKKFMMDSQQMEHLEFPEEFNCKEDALSKLPMIVDFEKDSDDSENELKSFDAFSDDYIVEAIDESIANENNDNSANPETDQVNYSPSPRISAIQQFQHRIHLRNKQEMLENAHFSPLDTSTERSYHADVACFKAQNLPIGVKHFKCTISKVLSATELQISPQLNEFTKQEIGLVQETSALIREAKQLHPVQIKEPCLARYPQDNQWYRAIIEELHQSSQQATVFYIDFHDTEMVPFTDLKMMPKELFMFPQRSFRVKLHGIKMNRNFSETSVRHSLQACLYKYSVVFARVHYPHSYDNNGNDSSSGSEPSSFTDSVRQRLKPFEVDIYENEQKTELLYKPLIDSRLYLLK
ncbi:uncharacterized protein LOC117789517 [Drosophila innubila]|uniref:uncharacterized protein LOC117789517 n=1 Tax=Drosophila innubila TaxID=198719 RepID=UPI00148D3DF9|nr:uncharacterized protein LOC117789517 [Drosophila innubila]